MNAKHLILTKEFTMQSNQRNVKRYCAMFEAKSRTPYTVNHQNSTSKLNKLYLGLTFFVTSLVNSQPAPSYYAYEIKDLTQGLVNCVPDKINDKGQVVGSYDFNGFLNAGFVTAPKGKNMKNVGITGTSQDLLYTTATGINNFGEVVGQTLGRAYVTDRKGNSISYLSLQGSSDFSSALEINDQGHIIGQIKMNGIYYHYFSVDKGNTFFTLPDKVNYIHMNNIGQITGRFSRPAYGSGADAFITQAFGSNLAIIPNPPGYVVATPMGINDKGIAAGYMLESIFDGDSYAALFSLSKGVYSMGINDTGYSPMAINNKNWTTGSIASRAYLTNPSNELFDLNHLTQNLPAGEILSHGRSINNKGQIAALGINSQKKLACYIVCPTIDCKN